jgi:dipeptidase E
MAKLYLLGGENTLKQNAKQINQQAFQDAGSKPVVLVIPWARPSFDSIYERRRRLRLYFNSLGAQKTIFADYSDTPQQTAAEMMGSDLIYLTGGQTSILLERLKTKAADLALSDFEGVIVGRSAGALALCKRALVTDRNTKQTKIIQGLGLADLTAKVHYRKSKDILLRNLSNTEKIYAIPQGSAIIYNNGTISTLGNVYLFENKQKYIVASS